MLSKVGDMPLLVRNLLFSLLFILLFFLFRKIYRAENIRVNKVLYWSAIVILALYVLALLSNRYVFFGFTKSNFILFAYAHLVIMAAGFTIYMAHLKKNKSTVVEPVSAASHVDQQVTYPFQLDEPLGGTNGDLFGRTSFANRIADKIISTYNNSESIAVAITGSWGSGKSSFLNMIKLSLQEKSIVFEFNPWKNDSAENIIKSFFSELASKIEKENEPGSIRHKLLEYASMLTEIDENFYTKTIKQAVLIGNKPKDDFETLYSKINAYIKSLDKKLVIFIDDIDRLDKPEIIQVLKLIRKTASFSNAAYIAAFDKNYVLEAVKELNAYSYVVFLEKIFLFEFSLPIFEANTIRSQIKTRLKDAFAKNKEIHAEDFTISDKTIEEAIDLETMAGFNLTDELIQTQREAIRIVNSIVFEVQGMSDEIDFLDFYIVQIIKFKYPRVYKLIQKKNWFFIKKDRDDSVLVLKNKEGKPINDLINYSDSVLENHILNNVESLLITKEDSALIMNLVKELLYREFNSKSFGPFYMVNDKCFRYDINFHKYFALRMLETDLSEVEFNEWCSKDYGSFSAALTRWLKAGKINSVHYYLTKWNAAKTVNQFENRIRTLHFYVSHGIFRAYKFESPWKKESILNFASWPVYNNNKRLTFYSSIEEYKKFINDFIVENRYDELSTEEKSNFFYRWAKEQPNGNIAYSVTEMLDYCEQYFVAEEVALSKELKSLYFSLIRNCKTMEKAGKLNFKPYVFEKIAQYIQKFSAQEYLGLFIVKAKEQNRYTIRKKLFQEVFGIKELKYYSYPETNSNDRNSIVEFNEFLDRIKNPATNPSHAIITFTILQPKDWPILDELEAELS